MSKRQGPLHPDAPLYLNDHSRPVSRRELISQGFRAGMGTIVGGSLSGLLVNSALAQEINLSNDLTALMEDCGIATQGAGKIPFICFDLAGGASMAGTNVLVGGRGGQRDFLSTAGYSLQGLPGDMTPASSTEDFINDDLGLAFHSDSQFLAGILEKAGGRAANINGAVIPARSENDTGNNPHNPMYAINRAGADGELLALVGSRTSESGGNSLAPAATIDPSVRPTKVDRPSDVTGLVDVGDLVSLMDQQDTVAVMESIYRISDARLANVDTGTASVRDEQLKKLLRCGYVKSADLAARFGDPAAIDPEEDPDIVGPSGIFSEDEFYGDGEFRKAASVMKLVIEGRAGAGTVTMGGYDYHTGERGTGEIRDLRAGRCMGACLEYAARKNVPLMLYVFSDGSVFSNGTLDNTVAGRGKGVWTGDSQQTAASFFLVYNPGGRPKLMETNGRTEGHQQIGYMRPSGDVETASTPIANNVNLLVEAVALNYMALHGQQDKFECKFKGHGLGNSAAMDRLTAFTPICNGTIDQLV